MMQKRPKILPGTTYQEKSGCGAVYITCNDMDNKLFEVFITMGKAGGCGAANTEGLGKAISIGLRSGTDPQQFVKHLKGIGCPRTNEVLGINSCITCIANCIELHESEKRCLNVL
jgi:ribonucleoside-diphosphate reductase alpha chain